MPFPRRTTGTRTQPTSGSAVTRKRGASRGSPQFRLRLGFILIAMTLSVLGARLVQLQGVDPGSYASMAAAGGVVDVELPAERGDILDRFGVPLADSVTGKMVVVDPYFISADQAPELAKLLATQLDIDYFRTLKKIQTKTLADGRTARYAIVARQVPATRALDVVAHATSLGFEGLICEDDPIRDYPAGDVAANLIGFMGIDEPLGGFERTFDSQLAGRDGKERYTVGAGKRVPLGESSTLKPVDGKPLRTTLDQDLQWFTLKVLTDTLAASGGDSGSAVVINSKSGEVLALADAPTFDANHPLDADKDNLGSRAMSEPYEPGSVEKVLTVASLIDAGKVTPRTKLVVPGSLARQDRVIHDWWDHGTLNMTLAGVIAQSSNIGTVKAADTMTPAQLVSYLQKFGLGSKTEVGARGETRGLLTPGDQMNSQTKDRVAFGQSLSVNVLQMAAAVNTIANGGVHVTPSLIQGSATTDDGVQVGTDHATATRVVSAAAARGTMKMMERVVDERVGVAPGAQVPGYRVAGKTGTAQRVDPACGCYRGTTVSFAGFAPADDPQLTAYVVIHNPREGSGGGSTAGPAFSRIMAYALARYGVAPTGTRPSQLPVTW